MDYYNKGEFFCFLSGGFENFKNFEYYWYESVVVFLITNVDEVLVILVSVKLWFILLISLFKNTCIFPAYGSSVMKGSNFFICQKFCSRVPCWCAYIDWQHNLLTSLRVKFKALPILLIDGQSQSPDWRYCFYVPGWFPFFSFAQAMLVYTGA